MSEQGQPQTPATPTPSTTASVVNPLENMWEILKADALAAWNKVKAIGVDIEEAIVPIVESEFAQFVSMFSAQAAQFVVAEAQNLSSVGSEKLSNVQNNIVETAESSGQQFTSSINTMARTLAQNSFQALSQVVTADTATSASSASGGAVGSGASTPNAASSVPEGASASNTVSAGQPTGPNE